MELVSNTTALSPAVKQLICCIGCDSEIPRNKEQEQLIERERTYISTLFASNVELRLDEIVALIPASDNTKEYFEKTVAILAPVFAQCQHNLSIMSDSDLESKLLPRLQWMHSEKILCDCLEILRKQQKPGSNVLILLLISAVLERSLGNVYLLKGSQCPSMLKDLLITEELVDTLGMPLIRLLGVMIGPPTSLNLRNVAWHGFLGDAELSSRYCCFLILLAANIGDVLSGKGICHVPQRPFVSCTPAMLSSMLVPSAPLKDGQNLHSMRELLIETSLIQSQTEDQWQLVLDLCDQERYGYCLVLLLPLLEHCFRRLFVTVNACPERVLTAESSALYTTFSEMLERTLPEGKINKLPAFLTEPCMDLLQDLLFYPDGPRVRDHLSHGEVYIASVDEKFVYPFLCIAVFLAHLLKTEPSSLSSSYPKEMVMQVKTYRSLFHPVAILQQKLTGLLCQLEKTGPCVLLSADLEWLGENDGPFKLCEDNTLLSRAQKEVSSLWQNEQWSISCPVTNADLSDGFSMHLDPLQKVFQEKIPTLFRWQLDTESARQGIMKESEFIGLMLRITEECTTITEQMQVSLQQRQKQLLAKELRSRQRDNLKKLLICVPCLQILLAWLSAVLGWNLLNLDKFSSIEPQKCRVLQKFLKLTLQHCENVQTFTSSDKNKWTESVELLLCLIPKCRQFLIQWQRQS